MLLCVFALYWEGFDQKHVLVFEYVSEKETIPWLQHRTGN